MRVSYVLIFRFILAHKNRQHSYNALAQRMVTEHGFPESLLTAPFRPEFWWVNTNNNAEQSGLLGSSQRGLVFDLQRGNFLKVSETGVIQAYVAATGRNESHLFSEFAMERTNGWTKKQFKRPTATGGIRLNLPRRARGMARAVSSAAGRIITCV